ISVSHEGTIRVWDFHTGDQTQCVKTDTFDLSVVATTPNGVRIVFATKEAIRVQDLNSDRQIQLRQADGGRVTALAVPPNSSRLVSASDDWKLRLWDIESGAELRVIHLFHTVKHIAITPDGERAITASANSVGVVDLGRGVMDGWYRGHSKTVAAV